MPVAASGGKLATPRDEGAGRQRELIELEVVCFSAADLIDLKHF